MNNRDGQVLTPEDILTELKQVSGITEAMLFPDFEKFAFLRREGEPYTVRSAHEYMELAREQLNREQLNIDEYDKVMTIRFIHVPREMTCFNRSTVFERERSRLSSLKLQSETELRQSVSPRV